MRVGARGALVATLALLVAFVLVRLVAAPLSVPGAGLAERLIPVPPGGSVDIGGVSVQIGAGVVEVGLRNVRVRAEGMAASLPRISVAQGLRGRSVRVEGPLVRLDPAVREGGDVGLPDARSALRSLDEALAGASEALGRHGVESVEVANGRLEIVHSGRPIEEARVFQDVAARLRADRDLYLALSLVGGEGRIDASLRREASEAARTISANLSGLVPQDLVFLKPVEEGFPLNASLEARLTPVDVDAEVLIEVGSGTVVFGMDPPRTLDAARIALSLAPSGALLLDEAVFEAGGSRVPVSGTIAPGASANAPWNFDLAADGALFDPPDLDEPSQVVERIEAEGRIDLPARQVHIDRFTGLSKAGRADGLFTFDFSDGPRVSGAARLGPASIGALRAIWPPAVAHGPRRALLGTVLGGFVERVDVDLALTPLELDGNPTTHDMIEGGMSVTATFRDATLTAAELPLAVRRASGQLMIRDKSLAARIDGGLLGADGQDLRVVEATFEIPRLHDLPQAATLQATVEGPLSAVVAIAERLDMPQLEKFAVEPADVEGTVRAKASLATPLGRDVPAEKRRWSILADLTGAGASVPLAGRTVTNANLEVRANNRKIAARGSAEIDGLTVDVDYSEAFAGEKSGVASFVLTDEERRRRGFDTGEMVRGPVVIKVEAGQDDRRTFVADLTEAEIALPVFGKPAGRSLKAEGVVVGEDDRMQVRDLRLEGAGAEIAGALMVSAGALEWASLEEVAFADGDEARLDVESVDGGGYRVEVEAERLDARRMVAAMREGGGGGSDAAPPPLALTARADRLRLADDAVATGVFLEATHDGERLKTLALAGRLDDLPEGSFAAKVAPGENRTREVHGDLRELGRLLSAFGIYGRMEGGQTTLRARLDEDGVLVGRVLVRDFALTNEQTLAAVITRARNAQGVADQRNPLPLPFRGNGSATAIPFDRLVIDFEKRDDVIFIREAILRGPVMGGSMEGTVDLAERSVALNGTFIPAYGVNNLFGRLPVFGEILGGGETGGLIGVTFRLAGPLDDPRLLLNPISAIAPGIFRRIFEFR